MVLFFVNHISQSNYNQRIKCHQRVEAYRRNDTIQNNLSEIADEKIDRIQKKQVLCYNWISVNRIEDCRKIHQKLGEYRPKILQIPEKDIHCRQNHAHANIKNQQKQDRIQQKKNFQVNVT